MSAATGEGDGITSLKGSWPKRMEFSYEYINKAEYPIMFMHFNAQDSKELI